MEDVWLGWKHRNESRMNEAMLGGGGGAKATSVDPQNPCSNVFNGLKLLLNKRNLTGFFNQSFHLREDFQLQISSWQL